MHGNYIVTEGLEGSGKTTACKVIIDTLKDLGVKKIIFTREPGGTRLAEKLRNILLDAKSDKEIISNKAEALIFYAARAQLVETIIKPALSNGSWVISDRHDLSTHAYQGGGRGIDQKILSRLRDLILGDFRPGLTFYLDVTPEIGFRRVNFRGKLDRIEQESIMFFNRIRARYLELAAQDANIYKIDATQSLEVVTYTIREFITRWFTELKL